MQNVLGQAPKLHLLWVQHIARLRDESVPDLYIERRLLEAKSRILHLGGTLRDEGMNVISILIIPVCIGNRTSAHSRGGGKCYAHCTHGNNVFKSPRRGFEAHQLMKFIQASVTVNRSEEHTSELQSRQYLVCRLLLEKKKKKAHQ